MRLFRRSPRCRAFRRDWGHPLIRCQHLFRHEGTHRYEDDTVTVEWGPGAWGAMYVRKPRATDSA